MITIKDLKNILINQTSPHDIINILVFENHVELLGLTINSIKSEYNNLPNYQKTVVEYSYEIYRALSEYNDDLEVYIATSKNHLKISDSNMGGSFITYNTCNHTLIFNNDWNTVFEFLGN